MKFKTNLPKGDSSSKDYLKLRDGESVKGIFRNDPKEFFVVWQNKKPTEVPEGTPNSKFRFRINFVVKEGTSYVPKIFEQGQAVYEQLAELHGEYPLEKTVCKISRKGTELDTEYTILPLRDQVTPEMEAVLNSLQYHDLKSKGGSAPNQHMAEDNEDWGPPPPNNDDEIPF